jgi:hypothetical protein
LDEIEKNEKEGLKKKMVVYFINQSSMYVCSLVVDNDRKNSELFCWFLNIKIYGYGLSFLTSGEVLVAAVVDDADAFD